MERVKTQVPMQRGGQPEEVAAAILWLLSAESSYVSGAFIDVCRRPLSGPFERRSAGVSSLIAGLSPESERRPGSSRLSEADSRRPAPGQTSTGR